MSVDSITDDLRASVEEEILRDLEDQVSPALRDLIVTAAPKDTGFLASNIFVDPWRLEGTTFVSFARAMTDYAQYTDEGTGIYGPTGGRIYPTSARALHFFSKAAGGFVFAASVAGTPAQHWFQEPMPIYFDQALDQFGH